MVAMPKLVRSSAGEDHALTTSPQLVCAVYVPDLSPELMPGIDKIRDDIVFAVRANAWIETHYSENVASVYSRAVELPLWT